MIKDEIVMQGAIKDKRERKKKDQGWNNDKRETIKDEGAQNNNQGWNNDERGDQEWRGNERNENNDERRDQGWRGNERNDQG